MSSPRVQATTADAYQLIHEGILALARAELHGIMIDVDYCSQMKRRLTRRMGYLESKFQESRFYRRWRHIYGKRTNIHSNHQLAHILYDVMKLPPVRVTESGAGSTNEAALTQLLENYPEVSELRLLLRLRRLGKLRDTYIDAFLREQHDGMIHPSFELHTVRTYRSSSTGPNFQNIPKRDKEAMKICRRAIIPSPGRQLVELDFASIEVRISAWHGDTARQIFLLDELDRSKPAHNTLRSAAKNGFVFPQFYGDYYKNNAVLLANWVKLPHTRWRERIGIQLPDGTFISDHLRRHGIRSFHDFTEHLRGIEDDFWNRRFRVYNEWRRRWVDSYRRRGWLRMLTGFVCSGVMARNEIVSYPIQGSAFHCLLLTFIQLDKYIQDHKLRSRLVGQIHDSVVIDAVPEELDQLSETAHYIVSEYLPKIWNWIIVPLEIDLDIYGVDRPWL